MQNDVSPTAEGDFMPQKVDNLGIDHSRALLLRPATTARQKHDVAQLRQRGPHRLNIGEANGAVAFSANEEHRMFHFELAQRNELFPVAIQIPVAMEAVCG
jgi:hypothetical protein